MPEARESRVLWLGGAVVVTAVVVGFASGTRPPTSRELTSPSAPTGEAPPASSYADLRSVTRGPNGTLYAGAFERLRGALPSVFDPVETSVEMRRAALERRAARRAYAGAPPTIPHAIDERGPGACLSCHEKGARVANLIAPAMSHGPKTMCVQCHATQRDEAAELRDGGTMSRENDFAGGGEPGKGRTAWQGAPPTIPHTTFMREACASCHGPAGSNGLKTPHAYRQSCVQCHASASSFDFGRPPAPPPHVTRP